MDRVQRVDEKIVLIYLVIMFTPRVKIFKVPEIILLITARNLSQFEQYI